MASVQSNRNYHEAVKLGGVIIMRVFCDSSTYLKNSIDDNGQSCLVFKSPSWTHPSVFKFFNTAVLLRWLAEVGQSWWRWPKSLHCLDPEPSPHNFVVKGPLENAKLSTEFDVHRLAGPFSSPPFPVFCTWPVASTQESWGCVSFNSPSFLY